MSSIEPSSFRGFREYFRTVVTSLRFAYGEEFAGNEISANSLRAPPRQASRLPGYIDAERLK